jgi:hypothetical protein
MKRRRKRRRTIRKRKRRRGRRRRRRTRRRRRRGRRRRRRRTGDIVTSTSLMKSEVVASANFWITFVWVVIGNSDRRYLRFEGLSCPYHPDGPPRVVPALNMATELYFETSVSICGTAQRHLTSRLTGCHSCPVFWSAEIKPRHCTGTLDRFLVVFLSFFRQISVTTVSFHILSNFRWYVDREGYSVVK